MNEPVSRERIIRPGMTREDLEDHLMEQIAARLVLDNLEHGGTGRGLTEEEMEAAYDGTVWAAGLVRRAGAF